MNIKSVILIGLGAVVFPLLILLPFMDHGAQGILEIGGGPNRFIKSTPQCNAGEPDKIGLLQPATTRQCVTWLTPGSSNLIEFAGFAGLAAMQAVVVLKIHGRNRHESKKLAYINLGVAILVVTITGIVYGVMRNHSQAVNYAADLGPHDSLKVLNPPSLGYGISPFSVVVLSAVYVVSAALILYRHTFSSRFISGVKKKELFQ